MTKRRIKVMEAVDTDRLYGSLLEASKYLKELYNKYPKDATLYENWYGYEDMEMVIHYLREETDREYKDRLVVEKANRERAERERKEKEQREKDLKEFQRLKSKLGYRY